MVDNATNFSRSGLRDWLIQRVTSIILGLYFLFILIFILCHTGMSFVVWSDLFSQTWFRVFSMLALLSMFCHAWIGIWTIITDYFTERMQGSKALGIRLLLQGAFLLLLAVYLVWGTQIIWGL